MPAGKRQIQGRYGQGEFREKQIFFNVREKSGTSVSSQGNIKINSTSKTPGLGKVYLIGISS